jgi:hypothetical protein
MPHGFRTTTDLVSDPSSTAGSVTLVSFDLGKIDRLFRGVQCAYQVPADTECSVFLFFAAPGIVQS